MTNPAEEPVQIVDRGNNPIGVEPRAVMRKQRLIHRATYILVFDFADRLFIQKRTITKDIYPGYWDIAAGGVVLAGEPYELSARRELAEELGVRDVPLEFLFEHYYEDVDNRVWGAVYRCRHEGPFVLQEEEVEYGEFVSAEELWRRQEMAPFTPDGLAILERCGWLPAR